MPDIRTLVSTEIHEPKHISDSTSADAGKVITPLNSGESELRKLTPSEVGIKFVYGEAALDQNTTAFTIVAAATSDLYNTADYVQLNATRLPGVYFDQNFGGVTFNATTNGITPPIAGTYRLSAWMNIVSDTTSTMLGFKAKQNGAWTNFTVKNEVPSIDRVQNVSGSSIVTLSAGDEITLWVASDKNANVTVEDVRYSIELIKEA